MDAMAEYRRRRDEEHERRMDALFMAHCYGRRCECGGELVLDSNGDSVDVVCDGCGQRQEVA